MSAKWNLDKIYSSIDGNDILKDIEKYSLCVDRINEFAENKLKGYISSQIIDEYISLVNEMMLYDDISSYIMLILSADSANRTAAKLYDRISDIHAKAVKGETLFKNYIKNVDLKSLHYMQNIAEHMYFLEKTQYEAFHTLDTKTEGIIAGMKSTGSMAWQKLWENITSSLMCRLGSKDLPLTIVRGMAYSPDGSVRKKAYESELAAYEKIASVGAFCMNSIKGEVLKETEMRGYGSALEKSVIDSGMDMEILSAMISAIDERTDELTEFYRIKAEYLGEKKLPFYDLFAPVGKSELSFTFDEAKAAVEKIFCSFSDKLGNFAKKAFRENWIDAEPRPGKVGGAFCENIKKLGESRILMNFSGNFEDVITLCHELGHGYHNEVFRGESPINSDTPMPLAETASTFCENLAFKEMQKLLPENALLTVKESRLSGELQSICDIYSRFLFEDSFFKERLNGSLSPDEICSLMIKAQKKAYRGGLDENFLHPYMWLCKPHYYDAEFNYYNYPYAFGDLFARSLFAVYEEKREKFIPEYDVILSSCGKMSVRDVGKLAGADFSSKDFWHKGIDEIIKDIKELKTMLK